MKEFLYLFMIVITPIILLFLIIYFICERENAPECTFARDPITCIQVVKAVKK